MGETKQQLVIRNGVVTLEKIEIISCHKYEDFIEDQLRLMGIKSGMIPNGCIWFELKNINTYIIERYPTDIIVNVLNKNYKIEVPYIYFVVRINNKLSVEDMKVFFNKKRIQSIDRKTYAYIPYLPNIDIVSGSVCFGSNVTSGSTERDRVETAISTFMSGVFNTDLSKHLIKWSSVFGLSTELDRDISKLYEKQLHELMIKITTINNVGKLNWPNDLKRNLLSE